MEHIANKAIMKGVNDEAIYREEDIGSIPETVIDIEERTQGKRKKLLFGLEKEFGEMDAIPGLLGGFQLFGDVAIYNLEGMNGGVTGVELLALGGYNQRFMSKLKSKLSKVSEDDLDLPSISTEVSKNSFSMVEFRKKALGFNFLAQRLPKWNLTATEGKFEHVMTGPVTVIQIIADSENIRNMTKLGEVSLDFPPGDSEWDKYRLLSIDLKVNKTTVYDLSPPKTRVVDQKTVPHYYPSYKSAPPDMGFIKSVELITRRAKGTKQVALLNTYRRLAETSNLYTLSSGSTSGQAGRLRTTFEIVAEIRNRKISKPLAQLAFKQFGPGDPDGPLPVSYAQFQGCLRMRSPFAQKPDAAALFTNDLLLLDLYHLALEVPGWRLFRVNPQASSGLFFEGLTRHQTMLSDYLLAQRLLNQMTKPDDYRNLTVGAGQALGVTMLKPKFEILPREKEEEKSRNYFPFNVFTQLPAAMMWGPVYHTKRGEPPVYKNPSRPDVTSLLGWSPWHGGLKNLLAWMARQAKEEGFSIGVYSDNVYIMMTLYLEGSFKLLWLSLDGSSMESSITRPLASFANRRVLEDYWESNKEEVAEIVGEPVTPEFRKYALDYHPFLSVDPLVVIGPEQFRLAGQGSGTSATAYFNNDNMTLAAHTLDYAFRQLRKKHAGRFFFNSSLFDGAMPDFLKKEKNDTIMGEPDMLKPWWYDVFAEFRIKIKLEKATLSEIFDSLDHPEEISGDLLGRVQLDLLGMDMIFVTIAGVPLIVPVLDEQRLYNSMVYNKLYARHEKHTNYTAVLNLGRLKALYLLGGWSDPGLALSIRHRIGTNKLVDSINFGDRESFINSVEAIMETIATELAGETFAIEAGQVLSSLGVPSMADIVTLTMDEEEAIAVAVAIMLEVPNPANELLKYAGIGWIISHTAEMLALIPSEDGTCRKILTELLEAARENIIESPDIEKKLARLIRMLRSENSQDYAKVALAGITEQVRQHDKITAEAIPGAEVFADRLTSVDSISKEVNPDWADLVSDMVPDLPNIRPEDRVAPTYHEPKLPPNIQAVRQRLRSTLEANPGLVEIYKKNQGRWAILVEKGLLKDTDYREIIESKSGPKLQSLIDDDISEIKARIAARTRFEDLREAKKRRLFADITEKATGKEREKQKEEDEGADVKQVKPSITEVGPNKMERLRQMKKEADDLANERFKKSQEGKERRLRSEKEFSPVNAIRTLANRSKIGDEMSRSLVRTLEKEGPTVSPQFWIKVFGGMERTKPLQLLYAALFVDPSPEYAVTNYRIIEDAITFLYPDYKKEKTLEVLRDYLSLKPGSMDLNSLKVRKKWDEALKRIALVLDEKASLMPP